MEKQRPDGGTNRHLEIPTGNMERSIKAGKNAFHLKILEKNIVQTEAAMELHSFVDASVKGYAACIYHRSESTEGTICNLLYAKSRLAPIKEITVARLELMVVLIGT